MKHGGTAGASESKFVGNLKCKGDKSPLLWDEAGIWEAKAEEEEDSPPTPSQETWSCRRRNEIRVLPVRENKQTPAGLQRGVDAKFGLTKTHHNQSGMNKPEGLLA